MTKLVKPPLTRAVAEAMRHKYVTTDRTVAEIRAEYSVSQFVLYHWLDGGPIINGDGERMLPPVPRRAPARRKKTDREKLVARLWQAAGAQVRTLENRLKNASEPDERDARTMAVLVKTLHDLNGFDDDKSKPTRKRGAEPPPEVKDDDPREIDAFRRELARRIAALDAAATGETAGGT